MSQHSLHKSIVAISVLSKEIMNALNIRKDKSYTIVVVNFKPADLKFKRYLTSHYTGLPHQPLGLETCLPSGFLQKAVGRGIGLVPSSSLSL